MRGRRWLRAVAAVLLAPFLLLALGTALPRAGATARGAGEAEGGQVLVLAGAIHTDIALPLDARTRALFGDLAASGMPLRHPDARWLALGWGGRAFYLETPRWADLRAGPLLRALTVDRSVLHAEVLGALPLPQPGVLALDLSPSGRARMEEAVLASFSREGGRPVVVPGASYTGADRFFEAEGRFNLLLGCNTWTAAMLREAGLRTGWWTPLPTTLLASLRLHNALPEPAQPRGTPP